MSHNLTMDFSDASFDESDSNVQPVPGVDNIDVVFPISDDGGFSVAQSDNRGASSSSVGLGTGPASAIALMPDQATSSVMEEFLFEFDNDLDHDDDKDTPNVQGLKVTTEGKEGSREVITDINIAGSFNDLTNGGTLDVYVDRGSHDHDNNSDTAPIKVFDKFSLGAPTANQNDDMAILVSGDMNGADMGAGSDMAMINVDASADMSGLFQGGNGPGIDVLTLVEGVVQDNGARVDFGYGDFGVNSAIVSNQGGEGSGLNFQIAGWEVLQLTDNADMIIIGSDTGSGLTNAYDAAYLNAGADNSMLKLMSGYTDGGQADVMAINADSNIYLSFDFVDTNQGIDAEFLDNGNVTVDDVGGYGPDINVDITKTGGTGLAIDYLEGTQNADVVTNLGKNGITVNLGGSNGAADIFNGSVSSKNDVLDARAVHDLTFAEDGSYIKVTNGSDVNALLKDVDYIMVRDREQGAETTQADINAYDNETLRLQTLKNTADDNLENFDKEADRLEDLKNDAQQDLDTHSAGKSALETKVTQAETALAGATDPGDTVVTQSEIDAYNSLQKQYSDATDPNTLVVAPTSGSPVGTRGVTDANDDGVVDLTDVKAFIDARLDSAAKQYFADNGIAEENLAQELLNATDAEIATFKAEMTDDSSGAALTSAQGFDDFIADIPQLVSLTDINTYNTLKTQATTAVDPGDTVITSAMIEAYEDLEEAVADAKKDLQDHNTETTRLEGLRDTAAGNYSTHTSGSTRDDLVGEVNTAGKNLTDHTDVARPVLTDVDFYRDMSHLNDKYVIDGLGAGASDVYGKGYDVMTSAQVDQFGTGTDPFRVYYEGEHDDFIDTDDNVIIDSADGTVAMSAGDSTRGYNWEDQIEAQTKADGTLEYGPGQSPGFYIEVSNKKLAVTFDDTKGEWKVDTTAIQVAEGATSAISAANSDTVLSGSALADAVAAQFGIQLKMVDADGHSVNHNDTKISNDIYLNATEEAITELLAGSVQSQSYNFDFYTKVDLKAEGGDVTVNVKLAQPSSGSFTLDFADLDVAVESFHNVVEDTGAAISSSSAAGEFVKIDNSGDIALGNGGDDTYVIGASDDGGGIYGGVALEYGNIGSGGGLTGSIDAVNINSVDSVDDLTFRRGKYRNEEEGSTLFIGDGKGNETVLFDNYNEYLDFRRVEYLTVEDGANNNEVYEIVTNNNLGEWDNEIYVADGGTMAVDLGGHDYIVGSSKADTFTFSLGDIVGSADASGTIDLLQLDSADKITFTDPNNILGETDEGTLNSLLQSGVASGGGQVTFDFDYSENKLEVTYDSSNNDLDQNFEFII